MNSKTSIIGLPVFVLIDFFNSSSNFPTIKSVWSSKTNHWLTMKFSRMQHSASL